jgi:serine protease Do
MKHKAVVIGLGILIAAGCFSGVFLAQTDEPPKPPDPQGAVIATDQGRRMIYFHGGDSPWLGITVADVKAQKARELKLPGEYGAIVQDVREGSPAAKAGLEKGDVILQFAGERVRSVAELRRLVQETPPGRKVSIEISRGGRTQTLSAEISQGPEEKWMSHFEMPNVEIPPVHVPNFDFNMMFAGGPRLGISADELTPQLASYFGVSQGKGVLVREVEKDTPAEKAGLKAGDVIVKINDAEIASVADVREALRKNSDEKRQVTLTIVRDRKEQTLNVQLEPAHELLGPNRVTELRDLGINQQEMMRLKDEALAQAREIQKNSQLMRLQKEKIRQEVDRAMQQHRKDLEQLRKNHKQIRLERLAQPI